MGSESAVHNLPASLQTRNELLDSKKIIARSAIGFFVKIPRGNQKTKQRKEKTGKIRLLQFQVCFLNFFCDLQFVGAQIVAFFASCAFVCFDF